MPTLPIGALINLEKAAAAAQARAPRPPRLVSPKETLASFATPPADQPADVFQSFQLGVDAFTYHLPHALNEAWLAASAFTTAVA